MSLWEMLGLGCSGGWGGEWGLGLWGGSMGGYWGWGAVGGAVGGNGGWGGGGSVGGILGLGYSCGWKPMWVWGTA